MLELSLQELETLKSMLEPLKNEEKITLLYNKVINAYIKKVNEITGK